MYKYDEYLIDTRKAKKYSTYLTINHLSGDYTKSFKNSLSVYLINKTNILFIYKNYFYILILLLPSFKK